MADKNAPWMPADYNKAITSAFQSIMIHKNASQHQQELAIDWIINQVCKTHDMSYRPNSERDTNFAEGKRFVGNQILKQINLIMKDE